MKSQYRVSGLLLAGFLAFAAGTPASALTEDGKNLLERLRGRIEAKEAAAAKPVETVAPPVEFKAQTPPAQAYEPGAIIGEPAPVEKSRKTPASRSAKKAKAPKDATSDGEKQKKVSKPLPPPAAPPVAPTVSVATNTVATPRTAQQTPSAADSARSFGELTDAELIQYAQEHMWPQEKSRKHSPPWTPPAKSKKKKGDSQKAATAPTKSSSKKAGATQTKIPTAKGKS